MDRFNCVCQSAFSMDGAGEKSIDVQNMKRLFTIDPKVSKMSSERLHSETLTEENFHRAHLGSRDIEEFPKIDRRDLERLKSIHIYTMQDLLGRFLIHDVPEEFHHFLLTTFQVSEHAATMITELLQRWTKHNLDVMIV